jgi:hypothetical protein
MPERDIAAGRGAGPLVSFVVPAHQEADQLPGALQSIAEQDADVDWEVVVVDGGSTDGTRAVAREAGARVLEQEGTGIGAARDQGAAVARGDWLAFVDADTRLDPAYLREMLSLVRGRGLVAAAARCRVTGPWRTRVPELITNHVFPRMGRPVLPGFNTFVAADAYEHVGGYPAVPNEDKALSRALGRVGATGYHPEVLVETSGRRFAQKGLVGALLYYLRLDVRALRSPEAGDERLDRATLVAMGLAVVLGVAQVYHGLVLGHVQATLAATGFFGGVALFMMDLLRPRVVVGGLAFVGFQVFWWAHLGFPHGAAGAAIAALQVLLALTLVYGYGRQFRRQHRQEDAGAAT